MQNTVTEKKAPIIKSTTLIINILEVFLSFPQIFSYAYFEKIITIKLYIQFLSYFFHLHYVHILVFANYGI